MIANSVYDLCRILVEQGKALEANLESFDRAIESFNDEDVCAANRNLEILATCMGFLGEEISEAFSPTQERDYDEEADDLRYGEDEYPW